MNPFKEPARPVEDYLQSFKDVYPFHYDKRETDPYTKARIILAAGAEYEANWFTHQMQRQITDTDLKRELALSRFIEKEQQQKLAQLKPIDETVLETTITYEQLAVDLTAEMAQKEENYNVKKALDFALLEDFDHLYRFSNLLDYDDGIKAENLVGKYTEITPARPTVAHHRHPYDNIKKDVCAKENTTQTILNTLIITAAEQQTMNFYMNHAADYKNDAGRKLYQEICLVEEEHVSQYGSLIDTKADFFECLLWHEFSECYVYWSNYMTEKDEKIKAIWEYYFQAELSHLAAARKLLKKYDKKDYAEVIVDPNFPDPLSLHQNIDYVRNILSDSVQFTGNKEDYKNIGDMPKSARFFSYNSEINDPIKDAASHKVIENRIKTAKTDYRFEVKDNPIESLRDRKKDNTEVGINPAAANTDKGFTPLNKG